jgi:glycosyltransferase involved in cell wall biosynthesis
VKRLLLVSPFFPPQGGAASVRIAALARAAASADWDVDVLTTTKHPDQHTLPNFTHPAVTIHEIPFHTPRPLRAARAADPARTPSTARAPLHTRLAATLRARTGIYSAVRMPDLTDHWVRPAADHAIAHARHTRPWDVVLSSCGPYTAHRVALTLRATGTARVWVADYRDLWTANHAYPGLLPFSIRERMLEREVLARADALTTVSEPLAHWLRARSRAPVTIATNGYDAAPQIPNPRSLASTNPTNLAYTGQLYQRFQDPLPILAALAILRTQGRDIRLTVAGDNQPAWMSAAKLAHLDPAALDLRGVVPHAESIQIQRQAHALLGIEWRDPRAGVVTNKIYEYIAAGPTVLVTGPRGPMTDVVERTGRGLWIGASPTDIATTIAGLIDTRIEPPAPNHPAVAAMSRQHQSEILLDQCERLLTPHSTPEFHREPTPQGL